MQIKLPQEVKNLLEILNSNNFEAFVVGGCVRDSLLGITPHDWDICTSATPQEIKECFTGFTIFDFGMKHGTISVLIGENIYEITTYRIDGEYLNNRHPENVTFTKDIINDLSRRDFTVNAIAYNEDRGVVDPFNGKADLDKKIIRCVGDADKRFKEDALRIIRALRFASVYDFKIEENTSASIINNANLLKNIAVERITFEFNKLLCGDGVEMILNDYRDVIAVFIPEIVPMFDYDQCTKHHSRDLWHHTTYSVKSISQDALLRMVMLLHDLGKPDSCKKDSDGTSHFKGHQRISADYALVVLRRLKYPTDFIERCKLLIEYHDVRFNGSKRQVKRLVSKIGEDNFILLLQVQKADLLAQSQYMREEKLEKIVLGERCFEEIIAEKECFSLKQLEISGYDLIALGIKGRKIGKILEKLLSLVIDEKLENNKTELINKAVELKATIEIE